MKIDLPPRDVECLQRLAVANGFATAEEFAANWLGELAKASAGNLVGFNGSEPSWDPPAAQAWGELVARRIEDASTGKVAMLPAADAVPGPRDA